MPHLVLYEGGQAPTTRSIRELRTLTALGWDVTVAHLPEATEQVETLGFRSCPLPAPESSPYQQRLASELTRLSELRDRLNGRVNDRSDRIHAGRVELDAAKADAANLPAKLDGKKLAAAKGELSSTIERIRASIAADRAELDAAKADRAAAAAQMKAIYAIRRAPTPLTAGVTFGDLARLEPHWHDAARAIAAARADVLWAADLNALPPVVWASQAAAGEPPPIIFDSHESFCDLSYLPELYRVAWRAIADRFVPHATAVITVAEPLARKLREEHGATRTIVLPNYAPPGRTPATQLREVLGLSRDVRVAVHVGNINQTRNPLVALDLIFELPDLHVAFVGSPDPEVVAAMQSLAGSRGVGSRLHVVPPVPMEELSGFIADADLSLILHTAESTNLALGMPHKLFDSLSAGVPVIAAEQTTTGAFVDHEQLGRTYRPDQPGALAAAARDLLGDADTRQRVRLRRDEFIWTRAEPILQSLMDELVGPLASAESDGAAAERGDGTDPAAATSSR